MRNIHITVLALIFLWSVAWVGIIVYAVRHTPASAALLHTGTIVSKATEKVDGRKHCFITIAAKDTAGVYHKRTGEVNCWLYNNSLNPGDPWQFND